MPETKEAYGPGDEAQAARDARIRLVLERYQRLTHEATLAHAKEFLEIGVTMPQAKVLYLVCMAGEIRMSSLAARLGISLPSLSATVERLVEHGLLDRHDDPADRRQVVLTPTAQARDLVDRFRELNTGLIGRLLAALGDEDLAIVERAFHLLAGVMPGPKTPPAPDVTSERNPA